MNLTLDDVKVLLKKTMNMYFCVILQVLLIFVVQFCTAYDDDSTLQDSIYVQPQQIHLSITGK